MAVVTTSGALTALLFGFAALVGREAEPLGKIPSLLLAEALVFFVAAAIQGLRVNSPRAYAEVKLDSLKKVLAPRYWEGPAEIGSRRSGEIQVILINTARTMNAAKGGVLKSAIWLEVIAVILLAASVIAVLARP